MSSISCLCADPLASVVNDACSAVKYGNQIVKLFVQKMDGTAFDNTVGNDVSVEADWDTKIAAVNDDKIITIGSIIGTRDSAEPTIAMGMGAAGSILREVILEKENYAMNVKICI